MKQLTDATPLVDRGSTSAGGMSKRLRRWLNNPIRPEERLVVTQESACWMLPSSAWPQICLCGCSQTVSRFCCQFEAWP